MMVDLFPPPQDRNSGPGDAPLAPRHDPIPQPAEDDPGPLGRLPFPHALAEAMLQNLSRWAGPVALIATLAAIIWVIIR